MNYSLHEEKVIDKIVNELLSFENKRQVGTVNESEWRAYLNGYLNALAHTELISDGTWEYFTSVLRDEVLYRTCVITWQKIADNKASIDDVIREVKELKKGDT